MITFSEILENEEIRAYIEKGNENLGALGFTEHARAHAMRAAGVASGILEKLGYGEREIELAKIAGYMHDIGNCVNRNDHAHSGAIMAMGILRGLDMPYADVATVMAAIGNHDEKTGTPVDAVSAALILADKGDVRRSRVRAQKESDYDIHDRVNYAAVKSSLVVDAEEKRIELELELDENWCSVMDYFEIFTERMAMCRRAAAKLGCRFAIVANGARVL